MLDFHSHVYFEIFIYRLTFLNNSAFTRQILHRFCYLEAVDIDHRLFSVVNMFGPLVHHRMVEHISVFCSLDRCRRYAVGNNLMNHNLDIFRGCLVDIPVLVVEV